MCGTNQGFRPHAATSAGGCKPGSFRNHQACPPGRCPDHVVGHSLCKDGRLALQVLIGMVHLAVLYH